MADTPCPKCSAMHNGITDSRPAFIEGMNTIRRRRFCRACNHRWSTHEFRDADMDQIFNAVRTLTKARQQTRQLTTTLDDR